MKKSVGQQTVNFIGDPHFGRKFGDVPLHRRGDREAMQLALFKAKLEEEADICVMVGDLFDTFTVSNETLVVVWEALYDAAKLHIARQYIMVMGNHDISRDAGLVSSFEVLKQMCEALPNITFVTNIHEFMMDGDNDPMLVVPYSAFKTADQAITEYFANTNPTQKFSMIIGHWDTMAVGDQHNLIPLTLLAPFTKEIVTGHVHTPEEFMVNAFGEKIPGGPFPTNVTITGSMMPYSHGEDPDEFMYVTRTIEQVEAALAIDPKAYQHMCLRCVMVPGEVPPQNIDCLQFSSKYVEGEKEKQEVTVETFSFKALFDKVFDDNKIDPTLRDKYWNLYREKATDDQQS